MTHTSSRVHTCSAARRRVLTPVHTCAHIHTHMFILRTTLAGRSPCSHCTGGSHWAQGCLPGLPASTATEGSTAAFLHHRCPWRPALVTPGKEPRRVLSLGLLWPEACGFYW